MPPHPSEGVEGRWVEPRGVGGAQVGWGGVRAETGGICCEWEAGEICEMLPLRWGGTQSSRELQRREPDFLNYLPRSVNRNTHLLPRFRTLIPNKVLANTAGGGGWGGVGRGSAGCCFHVAEALNRRLENRKFNFLSDSRKRRRNPALSEPAVWKDLIVVKVE